MKRLLLSFTAFIAIQCFAASQGIIRIDTPHPFANIGEHAEAIVSIISNGVTVAGHIRVVIASDGGYTSSNIHAVVSHDQPFRTMLTLDHPGYSRITAWITDESFEKPTGMSRTSIGFNVSEIKQAFEEPDDFDSFWSRTKKLNENIPMTGWTMTERESPLPGTVLYNVTIPCAAKRPVTGRLMMPADPVKRANGHLPARVEYIGYGSVNGVELSRMTRPEIACCSNMMVFVVNAHGIELDREKEYYDEISKELKNYALDPVENSDPGKSYFRDMILRDLRALEWIRTRPEWNGKDLEVRGHSQGGFQTVAVAALDQAVTKCMPDCPWMCDLGAETESPLKRLGGWFPKYVPGLLYYDTVNFAKRLRKDTVFEVQRIGLGDYCCPPSGTTAMYNVAPCKKKFATFVRQSDHNDYDNVFPHETVWHFTGNLPQKTTCNTGDISWTEADADDSGAFPALSWDSAAEVRPGIKCIRLSANKPRAIKAYFLRCDLKNSNFKFVATPRSPNWGTEIKDGKTGKTKITERVRRMTTKDWIISNPHIVVAANASPWSGGTDNNPANFAAEPNGFCMSNGEVLSDNPCWTNVNFIIRKDNTPDITEGIYPPEKRSDILHAFMGYGIFLKDGMNIGKKDALHPRTAYGLSKDRRYLILMVVDGRQQGWSMGANNFDLAELMLAAGAYDGINLDGGGSSALFYRDKSTGEVIQLNRHDAKRKYQRPVAINFGIYE